MTELSRGKSLVVLAIVVGCFAILWPKIFYPMFQGSVAPTTTTTPPPAHQPPFREREPGTLCCGLVFENDASSAAFLAELCSAVLKKQPGDQQQVPELLAIHLTDPVFNECRRDLLQKCGIDLDDIVKSDVDGAVAEHRLANKFHGKVRARNLTTCLLSNYDIDENLVRAKKSYRRPQDVFYSRHMRPERPPHLHPDGVHPALREKGRVIPPTRTIEKQAKPGPMPGMRPPMGAGGHIVSPPSGTGSMGILMPIYTIGIVVFFVYTLMKIMLKKQQPETTEPRIKDFHMDPEHRKYLFAEDYCSVQGPGGRPTDIHVKEYALLQEQQRLLLLEQQLRRSRSRTPPVTLANKEERVEDLQTIPEHVCAHHHHTEEAAADAQTVEPARTDALTRDESEKTDVVAAEEPVAEKPVVEEPAVEEPVVEEPVVQTSTVKEEAAVDEPVAEEPVVEEQIVQTEAAPVQEEVCEPAKAEDEPAVYEEEEEGPAGSAGTGDATSKTDYDTKETIPDAVNLSEADERLLRLAYAALKAQKDEEVDQLRRRLEETEKAMERICRQMGNVTDKLLPTAVAELFTSQLQEAEKEAQASVVEESVPVSEISQQEAGAGDAKPVVEQAKNEAPEWDNVLAKVEESFRRFSRDVEQAPAVQEPVQNQQEEISDEPAVQESVQLTNEQAIAECLKADEIKPTSFAEMISKAHEEEPVAVEEVEIPSTVAELESSQPEPSLPAEQPEQSQPEPLVSDEAIVEPEQLESAISDEITAQSEQSQPEAVPSAEESKPVEETVSEESVVIEESATESPDVTESIVNDAVAESADEELSKSSAIDEATCVTESLANEISSSDAESQLDSMLQEEALKVIESIEESIIPSTTEAVVCGEESVVSEQQPEVQVVEEIVAQPESVQDALEAETAVEEVVSAISCIETESSKPLTGQEDIQPVVEETISSHSNVVREQEGAIVAQEETVSSEAVAGETVVEEVASSENVEEQTPAAEDTAPFTQGEQAVLEEVPMREPVQEQTAVIQEETVTIAQEEIISTPAEEQAQQIEEIHVGQKVEEVIEPDAQEQVLIEQAQQEVAEIAQNEAVSEPSQEQTEKDSEVKVVEEKETIDDVISHVTDEVQPVLEETGSAIEPPVHPEVARCALFEQPRLGSEERKLTLNVCGMELTAEMEDHGKMPAELRPRITPDRHQAKSETEHAEITNDVPSVLLDTTISPESHLVVSEAECSAEVVPPDQLDLDETEYESSPVVLSGKMTLSVIGMELTAEAPDVHEESYSVEEPDAHRSVRFPPHPTDKVFLIPSEPEEVSSEVVDEVPRITDEEDEKLDDPLEDKVVYRPPTPPLHHLADDGDQTVEETEFLTYEQLEEVGEIGAIQEEYEAVTSFTSSAQPFFDSGLEPVAEEPELVEDTCEKPNIAQETEQYSSESAEPLEQSLQSSQNEEHKSIVQMAQQIREAEQSEPVILETATEGSTPIVSASAESVESQIVQQVDDTVVPKDSTQESSELVEPSPLLESTVSETVETTLAESVGESLAGHVECDTQAVIEAAESPVVTLTQAVESADLVSQSLADRVLMDVEYQILPTSESSSSIGTVNGSTCSATVQEASRAEEDFERNRELPEIEHSLEQVEIQESQATSEEAEPSISSFIIREDYPEDDAVQAMTEDEILQARKEIEAIKKLLAVVTSTVVETSESTEAVATADDQSSIVNELAHAMADDGAPTGASKGSSPDMDEFEVIRSSDSTASVETLYSKAPPTAES